MPRRIALITSNPLLIEPLIRDGPKLWALGVEVPLVLWIYPSMRLPDRVRDLCRALRRQARINNTYIGLQAIHYFVYRWLTRGAVEAPTQTTFAAIQRDRELRRVRSGNDPEAIAALQSSGCELGIVLGADVLRGDTLEAVGMPLYNIHFSDPAFVRGMPIIFWEILAQRAAIRLTSHELVVTLDAGRVLLQREVPIDWQPTLARTQRRTRMRAAEEVAVLVRDTLRQLLSGAASPQSVTPGPLRTTPTLRQALKAQRICRQRSARHASPCDERVQR